MNAIIFGTGADELGFNGYEKKLGSNHYGEYEYYQKDDIVIIPRHKMGHSVAPHLINYRANIHALKDLEIKNVVSIYAVGSISNKLLPSEFGIISDHVDFTHSRINTFFDGTFYPLDHVNAENQFSEKLKSCALALNKEMPRAWFFSFQDKDNARKVLPENSSYWKSLNGKWKFHFSIYH